MWSCSQLQLQDCLLHPGLIPTASMSYQHHRSVSSGTHPHQPSHQPTLQVGAETFRLCRQLVDGVTLVDNAAISAAIKDVFNETRSILEPAGAVAVAGAKAWLKANGHKGKKVVAVTSGANINFERLRLVSELADLGAMTEAMLATTIPERQGAFRAFVDTATSGTGISVTEFKYRWVGAERL
jgi:threonine dehydratase